MLEHCFLGANTPEGFFSRYDTLHNRAEIRRLIILKGGPGCGKSTLMKALVRRAGELELPAEKVLCSSDPDSLDALVLPGVGLAVVDGTAPHVVEPALCGCAETYLDLGQFYDGAKLALLARSLRAAKEENQRWYGPAYAELTGAACLRSAVRELVKSSAATAWSEAELQALLPHPLKPAANRGTRRSVFLRGITPKGLMTLQAGTAGVWEITDEYSLAAPLLEALAERWQAAGYNVVLCLDPLEPRSAAGLVVQGASISYLRTQRAFPLPQAASLRLDLTEPVTRQLPEQIALQAQRMLRRADRLLTDAAACLGRAKAAHDELEALYRPAVDFDAVQKLTLRLLERELG